MRDVWSFSGDPSRESYASICAGFRWQVPETFNFGADVVDRWARERDGKARKGLLKAMDEEIESRKG